MGPPLQVPTGAGTIDPTPTEMSGSAARPSREPVRHGRAWSAGALVVYSSLAVLANLPTWPGDPSRLATCACGGGKDPIQTAWFLAWTPFALLHGHNPFVTDWLNAPVGVNLAQNTSIPLLGLLAAPITMLVNPVASENLLRFLAYVASAMAMFGVLRSWTRSGLASFIGGLLYGFSPYMVGQASVHLDLSFVPFPPLILWAASEIVASQRHGALRWGLLLGAFATAQFYVSAEILATTVLTGALATAMLAIVRWRDVPRHLVHALVGLGTAAVVAVACCAYPVAQMISGPSHYTAVSKDHVSPFDADLLGFVLPTTMQLVAPHHVAERASSFVDGKANLDEDGSYLGIPLLVAVVAIVVTKRRRRWVQLSAAMALVTAVLTLGTKLRVDGRVVHLPFSLPFGVIADLPLVGNVLPARLSLFVAFFVAAIVALGVSAAQEDARARRAGGIARRAGGWGSVWRGGLVGILAVAVVASWLPHWPYRSHTVTPAAEERPAALAVIPTGTTVLTYPYVAPFTDSAMLWQADDRMRFKLLGSYMLRQGPNGVATGLPSALAPYDVEGMLIDALNNFPVPIPHVPYLAPTAEDVDAGTIVIGTVHAGAALPGTATVSGTVQNSSPRERTFYLVQSDGQLVGVHARRSTRYLPATGSTRPFAAVRRGEHVTVYGTREAGTVTRARVRDLRTFLRDYGVGAIVVDLDARDSREVVAWIEAAIGDPSRIGAGGAIWIGVQRDLHG